MTAWVLSPHEGVEEKYREEFNAANLFADV